MTDDGVAPPPQDRNASAQSPGLLARAARICARANRALAYFVGLPTITMLCGAIVGYYQYVNAYADKITARAGDDLKSATETFTEISKSFAEAQTLQQLMVSDFLRTIDADNAGSGERALAARHAQTIFPSYEAATNTLLESGEIMARNAEIHIDWTTDFARDAAAPHFPDSDPLSKSLLAAYDFDCDGNLPMFAPTKVRRPKPANNCAVDSNQYFDDPNEQTYVNLCPRRTDKAASAPSVTIHWYSAKHQVLTMHYCFHMLHDRMAKVRSWASQADPGQPAPAASAAEREQIQKSINNQAARLDAFMGLALFQINAIHVKYRPVSFACHVPLGWLFSDSCTPVKIAPYIVEKPSKQPTAVSAQSR